MKKFICLLAILTLYACGGGGSGSVDAPPQNTPGSIVDGGSSDGLIGQPASISLTANPSSLTVQGTSSITATVLDTGGAAVPDGRTVTFTVSDASLGTVTATATTSGGNAIATFNAANTPGAAVITATAGNVSNTVSIAIAAATVGSIEYVSATPSVIGIKGSGQTETSEIVFAVKDINGNPVTDGTAVSFSMIGPNGGEYINENDSTPTAASASTVGGYATANLHSGSVAGPVTIIASVVVGGTTLTSSSAVISIGGGVPSAKHFTLAESVINLAGYTDKGSLGYVNEQSIISAFAADRFGNFNILTGTSVSFYAEAGAIDRSATLSSTGSASVTFRTQNPMPGEVTANLALGELVGGSNSPRDGWVTILATLQGEEAFDDANGNGVYDLGENFTDIGEPFIDKNDDGCRNDGSTKNCNGSVSASTDPFEEYIDANGNGIYEGPNGLWDGPNCPATGCQTSKMIWVPITAAFTGAPNITISPAGVVAIPNGGSQVYTVTIQDVNQNTPVGGTTIDVSADAGNVTSGAASPIPDMLPDGPMVFSIILADSAAGDTDPAAPFTVKVTVVWKGVSLISTVSGTID